MLTWLTLILYLHNDEAIPIIRYILIILPNHYCPNFNYN